MRRLLATAVMAYAFLGATCPMGSFMTTFAPETVHAQSDAMSLMTPAAGSANACPAAAASAAMPSTGMPCQDGPCLSNHEEDAAQLFPQGEKQTTTCTFCSQQTDSLVNGGRSASLPEIHYPQLFSFIVGRRE